jgi:hypothetical protein
LRVYVGEREDDAYVLMWIEAIDLEEPCRRHENKTVITEEGDEKFFRNVSTCLSNHMELTSKDRLLLCLKAVYVAQPTGIRLGNLLRKILELQPRT